MNKPENHVILAQALIEAGVIDTSGVVIAEVLHDDSCPKLVSTRYSCNCKPNIVVNGKTYTYADHVEKGTLSA